MTTAVGHHPLQLDTAYAVCRHITRSSAKNFYFGFMVLPKRKRNALSAVYAFMRHADDISDDPSMPARVRRARLQEFLDGYHRVAEGVHTDDPVFMALRDSQQRYNIPTELLDKLVAGTCMDLPERMPYAEPEQGTTIAYNSFDELYDYCYHVASVVGLICIRIFGYRDAYAESLAEQVGVAFQLTNILRDVKEDAAMGRVYIPREDLERFGIATAELMAGAPLEKLRPLLELEAQRARNFYKAADQLLPLIDEDSQAALWVMVEIYRGLLEKIAARNYDVFTERVCLTPWEKTKVMLRGWARRLT